VFPHEFGIFFSISMKNVIGILMETTMSLCITFGNTANLTILILLIQKHRGSSS
jgi:hypothetical protein